MSTGTDWNAWHDAYADPDSSLSQRLRVVQRHIGRWLDATAPQHVRVVSACAGDGRDLLGVLEERADRDRVRATLVEADARNAARAMSNVERLGLDGIEIRCRDGGTTAAYTGAVPADLLLLCGVFGNVPDADVHRTIAAVPQYCSPGALVIWTRHRDAPDLTPRIRAWFDDAGCVEEAFDSPGPESFSVGVHRFEGEPAPLASDERLFTFFA